MSGRGPLRRWLATLRRRLGFEPNPVRRACDRAEAWVRVGLLAVFLVAAPVTAAGAAHWTAATMTREARAQAAAGHYVPAILTGNAPWVGHDLGEHVLTWAPARWSGPSGNERTGQVDVPAGTRKGAIVRIWTDAAGRQVKPPLARSQITSREVTIGALAPAGVGVVLLASAALLHRLLDRRRMAAWEACWRAVEPQWTRRPR